MPEPTANPESPEFYVGYLPVPRRLRHHLRVGVPVVLWVVCAIAILRAWTQDDPGPAVWDTAASRTFSGTVHALPYPMLVAEGRTLPMVEVGKHGGGARAASFDGRRVQVTGWLLSRDGIEMIELDPAQTAIMSTDGVPITAPIYARPQRVTLRGQIVDAKCYLGAMKPGDGKTHKACATLCIKGGIPPMLVTFDGTGRRRCLIMCAKDGGPLSPEAHRFIADPIEVTGDLVESHGISLLRVDPKDIRRL